MSLNVLRKADELLQLLVDSRELTVSQLAERSGEPRTSLYRILSTLNEQGLVQPGRSPNTYSLGTDLFRFAHIVVDSHPVSHAARLPMERLFEATGETTYLVIPQELRGICIARIDGRRVQSAVMNVGGSLPLHLGAAPLALLAFAPEAIRGRYFEHLAEDEDISASTLREHLDEIREAGYASSVGVVVPGIAAIAAPVLAADGTATAALALSGAEPAIVAGIDELAALVREAAEATTAALDKGD